MWLKWLDITVLRDVNPWSQVKELRGFKSQKTLMSILTAIRISNIPSNATCFQVATVEYLRVTLAFLKL
jgi:hypothetical protein